VQVLQGLRMRPIEKTIGLAFPTKEFQARAATGKPLGELNLEDPSTERVWAKEREQIGTTYEELIALLDKK